MTTMAIRRNGVGWKVQADMSALLVDIVASYQLGPLLLERAATTARETRPATTSPKGPLLSATDPDGVRRAGPRSWPSEWTTSTACDGTDLGQHIGYDRYGRAEFGLRATYTFTPARPSTTIVSPTWTAEKVDTDTNSGRRPLGARGTTGRTTVSQNSWVQGDSNYLGTEVDLGMTR